MTDKTSLGDSVTENIGENKAKEKIKCVECEQEYDADSYDIHTMSDGDSLCQSCEDYDRQEPIAWVDHLMANDDNTLYIGRYFNDTNGDFYYSYVKTDGWRGHYNVYSNNYTKVHDDCALSYSEDEQNLKQFDDMLKELAKKHHIGIVRVGTRTSNVFSCGVDYFVHNSHLEKYNKFMDKINSAKKVLRDPEEFTRTALFGE